MRVRNLPRGRRVQRSAGIGLIVFSAAAAADTTTSERVESEKSQTGRPRTAQKWTNRTPISHEPLICSKMCFTKTESVQYYIF